MNKVIACIDGSVYAASVCDHAAWAAGLCDATVEVVHVIDHHREHASVADHSGAIGFDSNETLIAQLAEVEEAQGRVALLRGRAILAEAGKRLRAAGIAAPILTQRHGSLVETITGLESGAAMIVLGKRGEAADFASMHLGANLERVARASRHPVLAAARAFRPIRRILVAFDGGPSIHKAIAFLAARPLLRGVAAKLLLAGPPDHVRALQLDAARAALAQAGMDVSVQTEMGEPEQVISRCVAQDGIDLLVIGAYGHSRIRSLIIGSTTTAMLRSCLIPVLMFR